MRTDVLLGLRNKISHYPKRDLILSHVTPILEEHDSLEARVEEFIYNDGRSQLLLSIFGVLPITIQFRNQQNTYNCPLSIWLPLNYPAEPPIILILPRSGMVLKPAKNPRIEGSVQVDRDGNVACRYLSDWSRKSEGSSLVPLIQILKQEFSQNYPLVSVSTTPAPGPSNFPVQNPRSPPPRPPLPSGPNSNSPSSYRESPRPSTSTNGNGNGQAYQQHYQPQQYQSSQRPRNDPQYSSPPIQNRSMPPNQAQQSYQSSPNRPQSYQGPPGPNYLSGPPNNQQPRPPPKLPLPNLLDFDDLSISSPPDPSLLALRNALHAKLTNALNSINSSTQSQLSQLDLLTQDLEKGVGGIEDEMNRLAIVNEVCTTVADGYEDLIQQAKKRREDYSKKLGEGGVGVDELVCSISVVHNQLLELIAEDSALEDTIYHLGRALQSESAELDLDKFLKRVRGLAIKQFEKRTLINQIERGM